MAMIMIMSRQKRLQTKRPAILMVISLMKGPKTRVTLKEKKDRTRNKVMARRNSTKFLAE